MAIRTGLNTNARSYDKLSVNRMNNIPAQAHKQTVFEEIRDYVTQSGFSIVGEDLSRPWGGFMVLDESQAPRFIETFFPGISLTEFDGFSKLSPKFLIVAPGARLSWQYHHRRAEIWRVVSGTVEVAVSDTDEEQVPKAYATGDVIRLRQGERHRLIGTNEYGVVAEIWQHTDPLSPSDESDIVRLQDDFGR